MLCHDNHRIHTLNHAVNDHQQDSHCQTNFAVATEPFLPNAIVATINPIPVTQ